MKKNYSNSNIRSKFSYKLGCNQGLQLPLKKINITIYFENLNVELHVFSYSLHTCQILC